MKTKLLMVAISLLLLTAFLTGCGSVVDSSNTTVQGESQSSGSEYDLAIDKLEVFHFHTSNQCYSCVMVGDYAQETLNTYFKEELEQGVIVFDHINADLPENKDVVAKYGVTGSSLWLGTYSNGNFTAQQNTAVWYNINDKQEYMTYLKGVIEDKLAGK